MFSSSFFFMISLPKRLRMTFFPPLRELCGLSPMSLQITPNLFSQTRARAMERHAHNQRGGPHHCPNLAIVEAFEITKRKHLGRGRPKFRYGLTNQRAQLTIFVICLGIAWGAWD